MVLSYANHGKKIHTYASKLCAAISDDFRNSPKMAAHDLDTYIFIFTKIGMLSPHFSAKRPAFLKLFFQWGSFDIGLIRVRASPEFTTVTSTMSRLNFRTYLTHCVSHRAKCSTHLTEKEIAVMTKYLKNHTS